MRTSRSIKWFPDTLGRQIPFVLCVGLVALLLGIAIIAFCVWSEAAFPSDAANSSFFSKARGTVTKPVVNAVSHQAQKHVRRKLSARTQVLLGGLSLQESIRRFLDEQTDLKERCLLAYRLASEGSPEAIDALLKVFQDAPPEHKAFMAQLIGSTGNPALKPYLLPLLDQSDERLAKAAVRGLSAIGGPDVSAMLARMLSDPQRPDALRVESALGLGKIGTPAARDALVGAFAQVEQPEIATQILDSLGQFPFPKVSGTFRDYLAAPETPSEMRVVAVEALVNSSKESVPFLLALAENDADPDVRASAAWAIGAHIGYDNLGPMLTDIAEREADADVRRRLYEAMLPQANVPIDRVLASVLAEKDVAARVAGFNALGAATGRQPSSDFVATFNERVVPELLQIASSETSLNLRMRAVFALRRAGTSAAQDALAAITRVSCPQVATAARNGLRNKS